MRYLLILFLVWLLIGAARGSVTIENTTEERGQCAVEATCPAASR